MPPPPSPSACASPAVPKIEQAASSEPAANRRTLCFGEVCIVFSSGRTFVISEEIPILKRGLIIP